MEEGDVCLSERLKPDVCERIITCKAQMERSDLFFALHLGERLYSHTDNLSKDIQGTLRVLRWLLSGDNAQQIQRSRHSQKFALIKASTISMLILSARVKACLVNQRFQENDALRPDWRLVLVHQAIPRLPKITLEGPIMSLFILSSGLSITALIMKASAPTLRWRPSWLKLLMVASDYDAEFKFLEASYSEDVDTDALPWQLSILEVMLKEQKIPCFDEILLAVLKFPEPEKKLIHEVQTICKLLAVNPATSAAGEGSFSSVRCLETWLRCRMADERFSNLEVLSGHRVCFR